jgi:hypothetical protein
LDAGAILGENQARLLTASGEVWDEWGKEGEQRIA